MSLRPGDLDLSDPDIFVEHAGPPHEYLALLRREDPVHWHPPPTQQKSTNPVTRGFFVLTKYADVKMVSRTPQLFSSQQGAPFLWDVEEPDMLNTLRTQLIAMDPPNHVKYRRLVQRGFTPKMVKRIEPAIRAHARRIVASVAPRGECEFVTDLACELPLTLICELAGIPAEDRAKIFDWSNRMIGADDPDMAAPDDDNAQNAQAEMWLYCNELVAKKRAAPDDTLISKFVHGEVNGEKISEVEINNFFVLLSVAGNETTRNMTSHFMRLLFEHPAQYELLKSDVPRYLDAAIEEGLRFAPPVMNFRRTATADTEVRGVKVPAGAKVYLSYPSANRDEEVFEDSMRFDITRRPLEHHLSFGIGEHFCLGANLARMQLNAILSEILTRLPSMELAGAVETQRSNFIHGIKRMPVRFSAS